MERCRNDGFGCERIRERPAGQGARAAQVAGSVAAMTRALAPASAPCITGQLASDDSQVLARAHVSHRGHCRTSVRCAASLAQRSATTLRLAYARSEDPNG